MFVSLRERFTLFFLATRSIAARLLAELERSSGQSFALLILTTHSIAVRLLAELKRSSGQSFALLILVTRSIATRLALGQSVALLILAQV